MEIDPFVSAFVDSTIKGMRELVEKGEEVLPQVILFARNPDGAAAIFPLIGVGLFFQSKEGKRQLPGIVKKTWEKASSDHVELQLCAVVMVSDMWVESVSIPEFEELRKHGRKTEFEPKPGMGECLLVMVSVADKEFQYHWPYVRGDENVIFTDEPVVRISPQLSGSILMNKLWPL